MPITEGHATANDLEFAYLEAGSGPLALCLHGFPDSAHTYRHLLPALADLVARASQNSQLWITTHSEKLAQEIGRRCAVGARGLDQSRG